MAGKLSLVLVFLTVTQLLVHLSSSFETREIDLSKRSLSKTLWDYLETNKEELRQSHRRPRKPKKCKDLEYSREKIAALNKDAKCKPRPYVIELGKPLNFSLIDPSHVEVMRCNHSVCPKDNAKSCLPSKIRMKSITVRGTSNKRQSCHQIDVEEHVECECACLLTEKNCSKSQIFDGNNCRCICPNQNKAYSCSQSQDTSWDQENCKCNTVLRSPLSHRDENEVTSRPMF